MVPADATAADMQDAVSLSVRDAEALDAIVEREFDASGLSGDQAVRAGRIVSLLSRLRVDDVDRSRRALTDATLARIARAGSAETVSVCELSVDDQEALEALVTAGYSVERVPRVLRDRAERVGRLLSLLNTPGESRGGQDLREATLLRVQQSIESEESLMTLGAASDAAGDGARGRWFRPRLADLVSVAALLLIGGSVLLPMFGAMRQYAGRMSCAGGMQAAGAAFGQYSSDHHNWAMASASTPGGMWWNFGQREESNSANLFTIARTGYTSLDTLACAGNEHAVGGAPAPGDWDWKRHEQVSYAYQNLFSRHRPDISKSIVVIMADKSPVVVLSRQHRKIDPFANSPNHRGRGQNVLFSDGRVEWKGSPVLEGGDNLWLPRPIEQMIRSALAEPLSGRESPASADDVMAVP